MTALEKDNMLAFLLSCSIKMSESLKFSGTNVPSLLLLLLLLLPELWLNLFLKILQNLTML